MTVPELAYIVSSSRTIEELSLRTPSEPTTKSSLDGAARAEWLQTAASSNEETFLRRLEWAGWSTEELLFPDSDPFTSPAVLPFWAALIQAASIETAKAVYSGPPSFRWQDANYPLPFEGMLAPFLGVARHHLETALSERFLDRAILQDAAWAAVERNLAIRLFNVAATVLELEYRAHQKLSPSSVSVYQTFVEKHLADGYGTLFREYPMLARLMGEATRQWVERTLEFVGRFAQDRALLHTNDGTLPQVASVTGNISDPHQDGGNVLLIRLTTGEEWVYKPKNLAIDEAFVYFVTWFNARFSEDHGTDTNLLRTLHTKNRDGYGWVEWVHHARCPDKEAAARYYHRMGTLLCLLYLLQGTDCHNENLIAAGEHPVLIDLETLLHPHLKQSIAAIGGVSDLRTSAYTALYDSVLSTGLLPQWQFLGDPNQAYDVSALDAARQPQVRTRIWQWQNTNTDAMTIGWVARDVPPYMENAVFVGNAPVNPDDHTEAFIKGFRQAYETLRRSHHALLDDDGPLSRFADCDVRFVFRATEIYGFIQNKALQPRALRSGVRYGIALDLLARAYVSGSEKPPTWEVLHAERQAMQRLDIPYFTARSSSTDMRLDGAGAFPATPPVIPDFFAAPSYAQVRARVAQLGPADCERQVRLIRASLHARRSQAMDLSAAPPLTHVPASMATVESEGVWSDEAAVTCALSLAHRLEEESIYGDGSRTWFGMGYAPGAQRRVLTPMGHSLYDGHTGIALFFAALYRVTGDTQWYDRMQETLRPLRQLIAQPLYMAAQKNARYMDIGGAVGIGSLIYALATIDALLEGTTHEKNISATLQAEAMEIASLLTEDRIQQDTVLDVLSGSAGALLALLALRRRLSGTSTRESESLLTLARRCGDHLLQAQNQEQGVRQGWQGISSQALAGMSHGAAGIAYALARLAEITGEEAYRESALAGIDYENTLYDPEWNNWRDLRDDVAGSESYRSVAWCHGAPGIGLARMASAPALPRSMVAPDIERALHCLRNRMQTLAPTDHLCCGNMGWVETLLVQETHQSAMEPPHEARKLAARVLARAGAEAKFRYFGNVSTDIFSPSFFQGAAGIGYTLLRLVHPQSIPSVLIWS